MAFVVTEACIRCRYTDCVEVCPVDCFHAGSHFLVINPEVCIDCAVCVPECPAKAIYAEADIPPSQRPYVALNAQLSQEWPVLDSRMDPLPDAEEWRSVPDRMRYLER